MHPRGQRPAALVLASVRACRMAMLGIVYQRQSSPVLLHSYHLMLPRYAGHCRYACTTHAVKDMHCIHTVETARLLTHYTQNFREHKDGSAPAFVTSTLTRICNYSFMWAADSGPGWGGFQHGIGRLCPHGTHRRFASIEAYTSESTCLPQSIRSTRDSNQQRCCCKSNWYCYVARPFIDASYIGTKLRTNNLLSYTS